MNALSCSECVDILCLFALLVTGNMKVVQMEGLTLD